MPAFITAEACYMATRLLLSGQNTRCRDGWVGGLAPKFSILGHQGVRVPFFWDLGCAGL